MIKGFKHTYPGHSFKAFTVMELIVTLLISGLLIAAAAGLILNFSSWEFRHGNEIDKYNKLLQFHKSITADMDRSVSIKHYDDEVIFSLKNDVHISYKLNYRFVVRSVDESADTFSIDIQNWYMEKDKNTGLPVKLEVLTVNDQEEIDTFLVIKNYDNDQLFNYTEMKNLSLN